jgi:solute carrier family 35 protein E1
LDTVIIAGLFAVWYLSNIYFNIYNKQVLNVFGHPGACTWIHLAVSSVLAIALWVVRVQPRPPLTPRVVDVIFPLAILHFLGFYTTNASLGAVNVSLTHTIKSMEPFFTVVFSWLLMKARPAKRVMAALIPVVGGVIVASATDLSFTWAGFIAAMLSNLAFQCRNVLSKKAMMRSSYESLESGGVDDISSLDEVNIFAVMSIMACVMMVPFVLALEGPALAQLGPSPMNWMSPDLWVKSILAGICRYAAACRTFLEPRSTHMCPSN